MDMQQEEKGSEQKTPDDHAITSWLEMTLTNLETAEQQLRDAIEGLRRVGSDVSSELEAKLRETEKTRKAFQHVMAVEDPAEREHILAAMNYGEYPPEALAGPKSFIVKGPETLQ